MTQRARTRSDRTENATSLAEMRALAHPLRLRLCELFAERPRTTKQAAAVLGVPPTRLYHHVHALERAGLLRLRETRRTRGADEKYYEVPHVAQSGLVHIPPHGDLTHRRQRAALGATALDVARRELTAALARPGGSRGSPLVARVLIPSQEVAERIRAEILALLRPNAGVDTPASHPAPAREDDGQSWSLTVVLVPSGSQRRGTD